MCVRLVPCACVGKRCAQVTLSYTLHPLKSGLISLNGQTPKSATKTGGPSHPDRSARPRPAGPPSPPGPFNERASVGNFPRSLLGAFPARLGKSICKRGQARLWLLKPGLGTPWKVVLEVISRNLGRGFRSVVPSGSAALTRQRRTRSVNLGNDHASEFKQVGCLRGSLSTPCSISEPPSPGQGMPGLCHRG